LHPATKRRGALALKQELLQASMEEKRKKEGKKVKKLPSSFSQNLNQLEGDFSTRKEGRGLK